MAIFGYFYAKLLLLLKILKLYLYYYYYYYYYYISFICFISLLLFYNNIKVIKIENNKNFIKVIYKNKIM